MKIDRRDPPRCYSVGSVQLRDCAAIDLDAFEQVTFVTSSGGQHDVARTTWGFYASPSLNKRLPSFGLRPALARNLDNKYFLLLVERGFEDAFALYCEREELSVAAWLDDDRALATLAGGDE